MAWEKLAYRFLWDEAFLIISWFIAPLSGFRFNKHVASSNYKGRRMKVQDKTQHIGGTRVLPFLQNMLVHSTDFDLVPFEMYKKHQQLKWRLGFIWKKEGGKNCKEASTACLHWISTRIRRFDSTCVHGIFV